MSFTTSQDILSKFELYLDDTSELSSSEELDLLNKVYLDVCSDRPWEFLKKQASGSILTDSIGSYITIPTDFSMFSTIGDNGLPIIYVGTNYDEYQVVNFSDRREYRNQSGYAYLDLSNGKIYFTTTPSATTYEFDYCKIPALITLSPATTPVFPSAFWYVLVHGMAIDGYIIQLFQKDRAYTKEHSEEYQRWLNKLAYYNSNLIK
ncbi:MAG: hypothetical protein BWY21_01389 [Parcubacteria group bacterium ADurb.Bin216]|nr:MAG: hypothetical protein BWY21_01389 [Parcubacteria group bacterium ADurb.Bin216]